MSSMAEKFLERAECCQHLAVQATNWDARLNFTEIARQWRELARQREQLEKDPPYSN
jgi:hypothetical protein